MQQLMAKGNAGELKGLERKQWEVFWKTAVNKNGEHLKRIASTFFANRDPKCNSVGRALDALAEANCWPFDGVKLWSEAGGHKEEITWALRQMVPPFEEAKENVPLAFDHSSSLASTSSTVVSSVPASLLGRKRSLAEIQSPVQASGAKGQEMEVDGWGDDDQQAKGLGDLGNIYDLIIELKRCGIKFQETDDSLDRKKVQGLADLFPPEMATNIPLKKEERAEIYGKYPRFTALLPKPLKKDLSFMSSRLSAIHRTQIEFLYKCQLRTNEKLRVCLGNMYACFDTSLPLSNQSDQFRRWFDIFALCLDDFSHFVFSQQEIILGRNGFPAEALKTGESIIPLEMKTKIKEYADFTTSLGLRGGRGLNHFSRFGNSWRGGGGFRRGFPPSAHQYGRGTRRGLPFARNSGTGFNSGFSNGGFSGSANNWGSRSNDQGRFSWNLKTSGAGRGRGRGQSS